MSKKNIISQEHSYTVVYEPIKDGGYQITVPLLPGLVTYGRTFEEARKMVLDAMKCHLEGMQKDKEDIPTELSLLQEKVTVTV